MLITTEHTINKVLLLVRLDRCRDAVLAQNNHIRSLFVADGQFR